jgi:hypothetical protein
VTGALAVVAAAPSTTTPAPTDTGDVGTQGPIGLALIVVLLIAVALLVKSMSRHLKRVPRSFHPDDELIEVPDTPAELLETRRAPGEDLLDHLRRAPRAIEPPRPGTDGRPGRTSAEG